MSTEESSVPGLPPEQGLGEDPFFYYTRVYLLFLQGLFKQFPSGCYRWNSDPEATEILITDQVPMPLDRLDQRPALITMRGPAQFANTSLDQLRHVDAQTGKRQHTDLIPLTMTINCLAKQGLEAQRIGWIVMRHIRIFKRLLQRSGRIHKVGDEISIGPETPPGSLVTPEADMEITNVVVHSPFFFQWNEDVTPLDAPLVQSIETHITANLNPVEASMTKQWESEVKAKVPTIRGVPLRGESVPIGSLNITVKT